MSPKSAHALYVRIYIHKALYIGAYHRLERKIVRPCQQESMQIIRSASPNLNLLHTSQLHYADCAELNEWWLIVVCCFCCL